MTAEIAILNRQAVALAADSAATIRYSDRSQKIFTSANKVFALSQVRPVGIMVYGGATFMGLPWETLIKEYRSHLGRRAFSKLEEYAEDFLEWIRTAVGLVTAVRERRFVEGVVGSYLVLIRDDLINMIDKRSEKEDLGEADVGAIAGEVVDNHYEQWKGFKPIRRLSPADVTSLRKRITKDVDELIVDIFEKTPLSAGAKKKLKDICVWLFTRIPVGIRSAQLSGVVVAGFGEDELFPHLRAFHINGRVGTVLNAIAFQSADVGDGGEGGIIPFAQSDVVRSFIEGTDRDLSNRMVSDFGQILRRVPRLVLDQLKNPLSPTEAEEVEKKVQDAVEIEMDKYSSGLSDVRYDQFIKPILDIVQVLPIDELAAMAEALVNLTSFKRRMSTESETVGGPIDVAVISKGDGLVWVKRKHYFRRELNEQYFINRMQEAFRGQQDE